MTDARRSERCVYTVARSTTPMAMRHAMRHALWFVHAASRETNVDRSQDAHGGQRSFTLKLAFTAPV